MQFFVVVKKSMHLYKSNFKFIVIFNVTKY